jgi:hypothetical protein
MKSLSVSMINSFVFSREKGWQLLFTNKKIWFPSSLKMSGKKSEWNSGSHMCEVAAIISGVNLLNK